MPLLNIDQVRNLRITDVSSNQQFEETTADGTNVYIQDGQLYIKPTLLDAKLITTNNVINLTASGTCTSDVLSDCVAITNTSTGSIVNPVKSGRVDAKLGGSRSI